ncbi:M24 family metallopeptidase [Amycolatopsis sp. TNS106]|uniref:M24 family metallopeptidase n=1 Tax=Amycolatopsis sp. TNS106 TaxID=2861750 RepID=UPI00351D6ED6
MTHAFGVGPHLPNEGKPWRGMRLKPGLVLAIEPKFIADGRDGYRIEDDGWTLRTSSTPSPSRQKVRVSSRCCRTEE